jgi:phage baseplate assembly protein W
MAYNPKIISPLDLKPSTGIGVKIPFSADNVFTTVYTTKDQTKYNLINFMLTDRRDRVFNPNFGLGLRSYIFEHLETNTVNEIEDMIVSKVEANFPNVDIISLEVIGETDTNSINIKFSYRLKNSNDTDNVKIKIQNS